MRTITIVYLVCLASLLLIVAGCTMASQTAVPAAGPAGAVSVDPWIGTWDTWLSTTLASQTPGILTLTRVGSSVTGTFVNDDHSKGTITGTVAGNRLAGTWSSDYKTGSDNGQFVFTLSDDKTSFSGTWVSASDTEHTLNTSTEFWNGRRRSS